MPYDIRLLNQASPLYNSVYPGIADSIELSTWELQHSQFPEPPSHVYTSADKLLPVQQVGLFQPSPPRSIVSSNGISRTWEGWKLGALLCVLVIAASLILNITATAWASATFGLSGGIGTMHRGPCPSIRHTGLWLHIGINILSTIMLGASNYSMQCLSSPTRSEVDKAHANRTWLDIGIQSIRNLTKIRRMRMVLWIILAASSIPLHLMFNSAVFVSLTANEYTVAAVTEDFVKGAANWTLTEYDPLQEAIIMEMQQNISSYERLDQATCIRQYGVDYLSNRRHAIVVVSGQSPNSLVAFLDWNYTTSQNSWVCGTTQGPGMTMEPLSIDDFDCSVSVALANDTVYMADSWLVEYCLSEQVQDICRLQFAVPIMVVVLCCNFIKLVCLGITIWKCRESTFVTLGDALSSLLQQADPYTNGMCTASKKDFENQAWPDPHPRRWTAKRHFRCEAVGIQRFILTNIICALAVIAITISLRFAINFTTTASDIRTLWSLGFGTVTSSSLVRWNQMIFGSPGLMKNVLLANSPQIILSLLYILYNRMYTCMSFSKEWHDMAHHRRPLRVTNPQGSQCSTYFLSLPYHYLITIMVVSTTTHWILSQSFFLVAIDVFDQQGNLDTSQSILTCGFSCIAIIFLIGIGWLVLILGVGMGLRRYKAGMPLAGSCSAALSAACHPLADEPDVALLPVKWGVVSVAEGVGHCALSSRYVSPPITWRRYAGRTADLCYSAGSSWTRD